MCNYTNSRFNFAQSQICDNLIETAITSYGIIRSSLGHASTRVYSAETEQIQFSNINVTKSGAVIFPAYFNSTARFNEGTQYALAIIT